MRKVLVIEDNIAEAINAQTELARVGINDFRAVTTLSEGLEAMPNYDGVLSDLFFPTGDMPVEQYVQRFLPAYEHFREESFKKRGEDDVVLRAVKACAEAFGMTPQDYVEKVVSQVNNTRMLEIARDAVAGIDNSKDYERFLKVEEDIRKGINLPLGIVASERAKELRIPSVIVTSMNHHDYSFAPVRGLINVPYEDTLIEGKKDWKGGIEFLLKSEDLGGKK